MKYEIEESIKRFRAALNIETQWPEGVDVESPEGVEAEAKLQAFQHFLTEGYPKFHEITERRLLGPYAVLYRWAGSESKKAPILLLAHYDVVPVDNDHWTVDPFGAQLKDGYIYGRGALDTKNTLICAMEAAQELMQEGFTPDRDIWFAFGGDEEKSGELGAMRAAAWFRQEGIHFQWILDEGSIVSEGQLAGIEQPLALIGVEEKGFLDIELLVAQKPGHASRPPKEQGVAILAKALCRIEKKPFPFALIPTVEAFFSSIAPYMPRLKRFVLSHAKTLGPLFYPLAAGTPETAALLRTTIAMTQLSGSKADNVMPSEARAILNLRLLPPWTVTSAVDYITKIVKDRRVTVRVSPYRIANDPVRATNESARGAGPGWENLVQALGVSFPEAQVIPFLVTGTTDSRHYAELCEAVYRFGPMKLTPGELERIHGNDERISIKNLERGIVFYKSLMKQM